MNIQLREQLVGNAFLAPTKDSRSPSDGSGPESAAESAVGRVGTLTARIISVPLGASGSSSRAAPQRARPAS